MNRERLRKLSGLTEKQMDELDEMILQMSNSIFHSLNGIIPTEPFEIDTLIKFAGDRIFWNAGFKIEFKNGQCHCSLMGYTPMNEKDFYEMVREKENNFQKAIQAEAIQQSPELN